MRYSALATVLIGLSALCWTSWLNRRLVRALGIAIASVALLSLTTSCSVSRQATSSSEQLKIESSETVERVDSVIVEQRDTLREVTTITIDRNDKGDTLKVVQITDRERLRSKADVRSQKVDVRVVRDTVYIEKTDSVFVQNTNGFGGLTTGLTNPTNKKNTFVSSLKWIFWILIGLVALIVTVKVCLLRR